MSNYVKVWALTIDDLETQKYQVKLLFEDEGNHLSNLPDTLQLQITPNDIVIAATVKSGVKMMNVKLPYLLDNSKTI